MARLLLIDDDIAEISAVKRALARAALAPVLATNASDALASIAQRRPDLLLVGATCESGGALAMARRLEDDEATRGIPLLVLGGGGELPARAVQLPRPVDPAALVEQVKTMLGEPRRAPAPPPAQAAPAGRTRAAVGRLASPALDLEPRVAAASPAATPSAAPAGATPLAPLLPPPAEREPERPALERRGPPIVLPQPLERRAQPSDPANARRAAVDALRARAEELRRAPEPAATPAAAEAAAGLDALFELAPPAGVSLEQLALTPAPATLAAVAPQAPAAPAPPAAPEAPAPSGDSALRSDDGAPIAETPFDLPPEDDAATPEEVAAPPPSRPADAWPPPPPPPPPAPAARSRTAVEEAEQRAAAEASRRAVAEAIRAREDQARVQEEARARAEAARRAEEAAARARQAEAASRQEAEARRRLEQELSRLRSQLEADRRSHETELRSAVQRTAAEHEAEAARRGRERESALAAELQSATETARRAAQEGQARALADAEEARRRAEEEATRRAEAEQALARLTEQTTRLAAERDALARAAAAPPPPAPRLALGLADVPPPDQAQEAARRRALALRQRREPGGEAPADWLPPQDDGAGGPAPAEAEPEIPPPEAPPADLRSGSLEEVPAPRLLALAARARLGGRLDVTGDAERSLWFEDGRVVGAASSASGERVEEVALRLGLLTREQHRQVAGPAAALPARRAAVLLVERGYVKPAELTALVRRRTDEVVFGVFAESGARWRWAPEHVPADERITPDRPTLALAVEGVRRRWLAPRTEAVLGGPASLLAPLPGGPTAADLGLGPEERRALSLADGLRTVDELLAASPLDALSTRQVLAAAVLTGAIAVRVVQAGRAAAQVSAAIDLARVKEKLEQARRADYFTILGLGRVCTPHEAREAADRLLAEFDPRRLGTVREEGLPARLDEIRRVVADARDVLSDDALRAEYLRGLGE